MSNCNDSRPHGGSIAIPSTRCGYDPKQKRVLLGNEWTEREKSAYAVVDDESCDYSIR